MVAERSEISVLGTIAVPKVCDRGGSLSQRGELLPQAKRTLEVHESSEVIPSTEHIAVKLVGEKFGRSIPVVLYERESIQTSNS